MVQKLITVKECEQLEPKKIQQLYRQFVNPGQVELLSSFGFGRELVVRAQGCLLETDSGRTILDFTGGMGVLNHGHNHPRILEVRQRFAQQQRLEVHKNYLCPHLAALSHNIATLLPDDLNICYFPNSGAEAVEGALKMAYKYHHGERRQILHADISYHGKLLGAGSISASAELQFRFPEIPGTHAFEYGNIHSARELINTLRKADDSCDVYALIIEPMSASTLQRCDRDYLQTLRALCDQEGIILIFDEVFSGWCKTGELFYFMEQQVTPDLLVTSKSMGGGKASISAFIAREPIFRQAYGALSDALMHSTTYNGFGEECATALEAVNILVDERFSERAKCIGTQLHKGLTTLRGKYPDLIQDVRGQGALQGILLKGNFGWINALANRVPVGLLQDERFTAKLINAAVISHLYSEHNILTYYGENREILLMAAPSLVITPDQIDQFLQALDLTLARGWLTLCSRFIGSKLFTGFMQRIQREPRFEKQCPDEC